MGNINTLKALFSISIQSSIQHKMMANQMISEELRIMLSPSDWFECDSEQSHISPSLKKDDHSPNLTQQQQQQPDFKDVTSKGCRVRTQDPNSLPQQTTVPTVSPWIHHQATTNLNPARQQPHPLGPWSSGSYGRQNQIFQGFHNP